MVVVHPELVASALSPPAEEDSPGLCSCPHQWEVSGALGVGVTLADEPPLFCPPTATQT